MIEAFEDRVNGFYLKPIEEFNKIGYGFASGIICVTTIDFLARIAIGSDKVGERLRVWLKDNISANDDLANRFSKDFRNGLVHEGRIKNCGLLPNGAPSNDTK